MHRHMHDFERRWPYAMPQRLRLNCERHLSGDGSNELYWQWCVYMHAYMYMHT
jgi:hypothetical protein